ncbi:probable ATP-dependent RNA helicase DDX31 [Strongylocentrotus purpuratus]|uniref:ATP-dependent RNA helicase n=1 Tax=Strongylocentrotus purpuratus TaxID=7668 RepID=A0A7M7PR01_STRPU|nr:probable ATP-dependent RNA helicase DDX31 [Strongylocentrotus purpuratus]
MDSTGGGIVLNLVSNVEPVNKVKKPPIPQETLKKKKKTPQRNTEGREDNISHQKGNNNSNHDDAKNESSGFSFNFLDDKQTGSRGKGVKQKDGESKNKQPGQPNNNIISSLFRHNPEIPQVKIQKVTENKEAIFSSTQFSELPLHSFMISNIEKNLGFSQMTTVQQRAIPTLLHGQDTLIKSQTGTGKTLAYAVPVVQQLQGLQPKVQRLHGPYALILVPTRELACQSFETLVKLVKPFHWIVPGVLMGGEKKKSEKGRIRKGINILVSTPGRLVDHINTTEALTFSRVRWVILDEADRLLDLGFEKDVTTILNAINEQCQNQKQTVLVSATLSEGVKRLANITLKDPVFIDVAKHQLDKALPPAPWSASSSSTEEQLKPAKTGSQAEETGEGEIGEDAEMFSVPERLKQQFAIVPSKLRLVALTALVAGGFKSPSGCKMLVFLSSCESVDFHYTLFQACKGCSILKEDGTASKREGMPLFRLHGSMSQPDRIKMYHAFSEARKGVLLCTDVAARGLDLPKVKWIVQYNIPGSAADYVHRVGRTARIGKEGQALLFLAPSEVEYIRILEEQQIRIKEQPLDDILSSLMTSEAQDFIHGQFKGQRQRSVEEAATNLQLRYENHVLTNTAHTQQARKAFHSFIRAYATYPSSLKHILHIKKLHLGHAAKSFGLREAPSNIHDRIGNTNGRGTKRKQNSMKVSSVSEFDSGLDESTLMPSKKQKADAKKKRRKLMLQEKRPHPQK